MITDALDNKRKRDREEAADDKQAKLAKDSADKNIADSKKANDAQQIKSKMEQFYRDYSQMLRSPQSLSDNALKLTQGKRSQIQQWYDHLIYDQEQQAMALVMEALEKLLAALFGVGFLAEEVVRKTVTAYVRGDDVGPEVMEGLNNAWNAFKEMAGSPESQDRMNAIIQANRDAMSVGGGHGQQNDQAAEQNAGHEAAEAANKSAEAAKASEAARAAAAPKPKPFGS